MTIALIVALIVLPLLAVDLMLAALPPLTRGLHTSPAMGQVTLSVFAASFALMQLVFGPLGDRFGRRPFALVGLGLFCGASIVSALAQSIELVLAMRVLQGVGAATGPVLARAVVRDLYGIEGSGRLMGFLMACFGTGAVLFPMIGGGLVELIGWRAVFWFAAALSGATLIGAWRFLVETIPERDTSIRFGRFVVGYLHLAIDARFIVAAIPGCCTAAAMFTWISGSSFVVQSVLGYSPTAYGVIYGSTVLGFVATSLLTARLAPRMGSGRMIAIGSMIAAGGGIVGVLLSLSLPLTLPLLLVGIFLMTFGHGFALPQSMAASIVPFPRMAATASALFGMLQYATGSILAVLNGVLFDGTALPMLAIIAGITLVGVAVFWGFGARLRKAGP